MPLSFFRQAFVIRFFIFFKGLFRRALMSYFCQLI